MATHRPTPTHRPATDAPAAAEPTLIEAALTTEELADRVEMVLRPLGGDRYRAAAVDGSVEFVRRTEGVRYRYEVAAVEGRHPLERQDDAAWIGPADERLSAERAGHPDRRTNSYPHAFDSIAQFFDGQHAPELMVLHTAAHRSDGNLGQHGSLGAVQARAPFIAAGAGIRALGSLDRSTRVVDLAPTIAAVLGFDPHPAGIGPTGAPRSDALLARQDGDPVAEVLDGTVADHVLVVLLDGCNANLLLEVVEAGDAPAIASLIERGVHLRHGMFSSLPTATLANHTTAVTGAHPGHSGVLHNTWLDRRDGSTPDLLSMEQMFWSADHLEPGVETLFDALERNRPGATSSATFEFCDRGATFSSFGLVRAGSGDALPELDDVTHLHRPSAEASAAYRFMSTVDHLSVEHTIAQWDAGQRDAGQWEAGQRDGARLPTLSWVSLAVTDEAGHESGPHGELARHAVIDSDARIADLLAAVDAAGATDRTAVFVIADHGMEQSDPDLDATWDDALAATGVEHVEVGGGLIYLGFSDRAPRP